VNATQSTLLVIGFVSVIAAIVGGNLKLPSTEFGKLDSPTLRLILGCLGLVIIAVSFDLPALTRTRPLKSEYLARLDIECMQVTMTLRANSMNMAQLQPNPQLVAASLMPYRQFSALWRRWEAPEGDDKSISQIQNKFDYAINLTEEFLLAVFTPGNTQARIAQLYDDGAMATADYNASIRNYGSVQCSVEAVPRRK